MRACGGAAVVSSLGTQRLPSRKIIIRRTMTYLGAAAILLLSSRAAGAIECSSSRQHDGRYWSYREIDGRRCWYPGQRGFAKSRLHWSRVLPDRAPVHSPPVEPAAIAAAPPKPVSNFERRWNACCDHGEE